MDDIRRQDMRLFFKELRTPARVIVYLLSFGFLYSAIEGRMPGTYYTVLFFVLLLTTATAWSASMRKRFHNKRMESL